MDRYHAVTMDELPEQSTVEPETTTDSEKRTNTPSATAPSAWQSGLVRHLKTSESDLWHWFADNRMQADATDSTRHELLKSAYRIDRLTAAELYQLADSIACQMELTAPVTLYQAQQATTLNVSIPWFPDEVHVVFHGPVLETLDQQELAAVLAHEFAHHELHAVDNQDYLIAEQLLTAMVNDPSADDSHAHTWRNYQLHTELYCDRRAVQATDDMPACIRALVKMETGFKKVSAEAYIKQADEVLAKGNVFSEGVTHPEIFIRTRAIQVWCNTPAEFDNTIQTLVSGPIQLQQLDLLQRHHIGELTRSLLHRLLAPHWIRTPMTLRLAQEFFRDFQPHDTAISLTELCRTLENADGELKDYFCYLLLDFATCDPDLEDGPLALACQIVSELHLLPHFTAIATRELKLGGRGIEKIQADAGRIVRAAEKEFSS